MSGLFWGVLIVGAAAGWFSWRYAWWRRPVPYDRPRILMYHMIREPIPGRKFNSLRVAPAMFERQIRHLAEEGWRSLTMSEAFARRESLPEKTVVITFDDGYRDNLTHALPILERYGFRATLYLVTDRHDRDWSGERKAKNLGAGLAEEPKLSDDEVKRLLESGVFEIGGHTRTHANLSRLDDAGKRAEICGGREEIEERFATACRSFAYPFGIYDDRDERIAAECGYTHAVTTETGIADLRRCDPYALPRITVSGRDGFWAFRLKLRHGRRGVAK